MDITDARSYIGNEQIGYKVAFCERDVALWGGLFVFGVAIMLGQRRWKSLPTWAWLIFGILPMGLDGGSQIFGFVSSLPTWLPVRESTPLLRIITGGLFRVLTAWFLFPLIEENMKETRFILVRKRASA